MNTRIFYAVLPLAALFSADALAQTVVTQRAPQLTQDQQTTVYRTIVREKVVPQTRPVVRRQVAKQTIRKPAPNVVRVTATERVVTRPRTVTRRVIAPRTTTFVTADPLDLTPDQRTFVYRTIVQQPLQPAPVVTERIVPAPFPRPYVTTEPVVTTAPVYGARAGRDHRAARDHRPANDRRRNRHRQRPGHSQRS